MFFGCTRSAWKDQGTHRLLECSLRPASWFIDIIQQLVISLTILYGWIRHHCECGKTPTAVYSLSDHRKGIGLLKKRLDEGLTNIINEGVRKSKPLALFQCPVLLKTVVNCSSSFIFILEKPKMLMQRQLAADILWQNLP